ncbi:MAG TPA: RICIN domain-containing protein [Roseiflexaceae bacterium]|nr:RICIN domain-containing protein [Roseiflexaceae bacterium]
MLYSIGKHARRVRLSLAVCAILALVMQFGAPPVSAANETVSINFALNGGAPTYRASGFIYGLSTDASQPAQSTLSDIKVKVLRGGGSQIGCPNGGWINGQLTPRWNMVKAYTAKARSLGGNFSIILAALWGADGVCQVPRWPGDNGNWAEFDTFLNQVMNLAQADGINGAGVRWDIWNEPNIFFWGRSQSQYLAMWQRAVRKIRATFPNAVIEGPSCACGPANPWFGQFLDYAKANNVVPNILSWHALPGDPVADANAANAALSARGLSVSGYSINEYGAFGDEQQPGPSAWYIARLERANGGVDGARANWGMVGQNPSLYATLGWLVTTNNQPMGQWWVYKRYADQTGVRTNITPSASVDGVVFQDAAARKSITLLGKKVGGGTGTVTAQFTNVPAFLAAGGQVNVLVERMPSTNAAVGAPTVVFNGPVQLNGSSLTVAIDWNNALDAYAVTLTPASAFYRLTARHSGKVVDVTNCGTTDGTNVQQWAWLNNYCQQWQFQDAGSGYYRIINRNSGKCLDVSGASTADGANVFQWTCGSGTNQQWQLVDVGGGFVQLRARHSGKCLDVNGASTADGANVFQWTCSSGTNQHWSRTQS